MFQPRFRLTKKTLWFSLLALALVGAAVAQAELKNENILKARPEAVPASVHIAGTSGRQGPQLSILEYDPNDFARIEMQSSGSSRFWHISSRTSDDDAESRLFFYNSSPAGNILSITGDGKVGIANTSPTERLEVNGNGKINGSLSVSGELTRPGCNNVNMLPCAMGKVDVTLRGELTVLYGTNNFTVRRQRRGIYCIAIDGVDPARDQVIGFANLAAQALVAEHADFFLPMANWGGCPGHFIVQISHVTGPDFDNVDAPFQFVVYKL